MYRRQVGTVSVVADLFAQFLVVVVRLLVLLVQIFAFVVDLMVLALGSKDGVLLGVQLRTDPGIAGGEDQGLVQHIDAVHGCVDLILGPAKGIEFVVVFVVGLLHALNGFRDDGIRHGVHS